MRDACYAAAGPKTPQIKSPMQTRSACSGSNQKAEDGRKCKRTGAIRSRAIQQKPREQSRRFGREMHVMQKQQQDPTQPRNQIPNAATTSRQRKQPESGAEQRMGGNASEAEPSEAEQSRWDGRTHRTSSSSGGGGPAAVGLLVEREPPGAEETGTGAGVGPAEDDASLSPAMATRRGDERCCPCLF